MSGDVVKRAVFFGGGKINEDKVLSWLAGLVRQLRKSPQVDVGSAGQLCVSVETGTIEIDPRTKQPLTSEGSRTLDFQASETLLAVVRGGVLSDERLERLTDSDHIASAFAKGLAAELIESRRAVIGNFGVWTLGRLPDLTVFIRFRSRPAIDRMLS